MPSDTPIEEQVRIVQGLLTQTQAGKAVWADTGEAGTYRSVRTRAVVVLGTIGRPPRVRLRFSQIGKDDFDEVITQTLSDAEPFPEDQLLDAYLAMLHQLVQGRSPRRRTAAELFLEEGED